MELEALLKPIQLVQDWSWLTIPLAGYLPFIVALSAKSGDTLPMNVQHGTLFFIALCVYERGTLGSIVPSPMPRLNAPIVESLVTSR